MCCLRSDLWGAVFLCPFLIEGAGDEDTMLVVLVISVALIIAGGISIVISVMRKSSDDAIARIEKMGSSDSAAGICPNCGLILFQF